MSLSLKLLKVLLKDFDFGSAIAFIRNILVMITGIFFTYG